MHRKGNLLQDEKKKRVNFLKSEIEKLYHHSITARFYIMTSFVEMGWYPFAQTVLGILRNSPGPFIRTYFNKGGLLISILSKKKNRIDSDL